MGKNRYLYYLVFLNMLVNVVVFVPEILIRDRFNGALMSVFIAVPISTALLFWFGKSLVQFPKQGLPEIFGRYLPKWLSIGLLLFFAAMWFLTGMILLLDYTKITKDFISPDVSKVTLIGLFLVLVCLAARLKSSTLLHATEILLLLTAPIILFILGKSVMNEDMSWDAIFEIGTNVLQTPTVDSLAAATFVFTGYTNMIIFHRVFGNEFRFRHLGIIASFGFLILLTSFLIPVGFHGTYGANRYTFPWVATADSMRIEMFVVERVVFLFILIYTIIVLVAAIIHWHISLELFKSVFSGGSGEKKSFRVTWIVLIMFAAVTMVLEIYLNGYQIFNAGSLWLKIRFFGELLLVTILVYAARRKKRA